jgi:hypothetical protein
LSGWESVVIYFGLTDLVPLVERAYAAERMFERTVGDFDRDLAYARVPPVCPFEFAPSIRGGKVKSPARAHMTRSSSTE